MIEINNIYKTYGLYKNPIERLFELFSKNYEINFKDKIAVLSNINLKISKGEVVGIIGRNGSGKSTLLQVITGTIVPTSGGVATQGKISALLELGSGFNYEFSGIDNIYLYGSIIGISRVEINRMLQNIIDFADIGDYIYNPVKTYSSGMVVRLAFAVSICVDPDILIVDEALSVGDELFQRKCFSRIDELRQKGTTILFVSHSASQVLNLCSRAILIESGEIIFDGDPKTAVDNYHKILYCNPSKRVSIKNQILNSASIEEDFVKDDLTKDFKFTSEFFSDDLTPKSSIIYESNGAEIHSIGLYNSENLKVNNVISKNEYRYRYRVKFSKDFKKIRFGMLIKTSNGFELIGSTTSSLYNQEFTSVKSEEEYEVEFIFNCFLTPGVYFFNAGVQILQDEGIEYLHRLIDCYAFRVQASSSTNDTSFICANTSTSVIRI